MIIITPDLSTGLWKAIINGRVLSFRADASGNPLPDLFVSRDRALLEARLAVGNSSAEYRVQNLVDEAELIESLAAK